MVLQGMAITIHPISSFASLLELVSVTCNLISVTIKAFRRKIWKARRMEMQMNGESNNNNNSTTATKPGGIAHVVQDDRS